MKPFTNATHFRLVALRSIDKTYPETLQTLLYYDVYCELHEAARILADAVIRELGDGDGENGGCGSLKNCYGDMVECFISGNAYYYADCEFYITAVE